MALFSPVRQIVTFVNRVYTNTILIDWLFLVRFGMLMILSGVQALYWSRQGTGGHQNPPDQCNARIKSLRAVLSVRTQQPSVQTGIKCADSYKHSLFCPVSRNLSTCCSAVVHFPHIRFIKHGGTFNHYNKHSGHKLVDKSKSLFSVWFFIFLFKV